MDPNQNNDSFGSLSSDGGGAIAGGAGVASTPELGGVPETVGTIGASGVSEAVGVTGVSSAPEVAGMAGTGSTVGAGNAVGTSNTLFPGAVGATGLGSVTGLSGAATMGPMAANPMAANPIVTNVSGQGDVNVNQAGINMSQAGVNVGQSGANVGQANAIFGQGNVDGMMPIGSGSGDIVIGGGSKVKPKKALVVGAIAAAVLIVAGLIMGVIFGQGGGSGDSGQVSSADQKTLFNSYVNYVMFGEDSSEDLTKERASEYKAYFESLVNDGDALIKYTLEANKKFGDFRTSYSGGEYGDYALLSLDDYFQRFPSAMPITVKKMSDLFKQGGRESVESLIDNRYSIGTGDDDSASSDYLYYIDVVRGYSEFRLSIIERASMENCTLNESLESDCYALSGDDVQTAQNYDQELFEAELTMRQNAFVAIQNLYDEIYGLDGRDDDVQDGEASSDDAEQTDIESSTDETDGRIDENNSESEED